MICHTNPYWLFDSESYTEEVVYKIEEDYEIDEQSTVHVLPDIILKWIKEGKPLETNWYDVNNNY